MGPHGSFRGIRIARLESRNYGFMFGQRLFRHAGVKEQTEYVKVDMLVSQRRAHQLVSRNFHDHVVKYGILARELGIAYALVALLAAATHDTSCLSEAGERLVLHPEGCKSRSVRLKKESQFVKVGKLLGIDLRGRAVTHEMGLYHQTFAFETTKSFADGRVGNAKFTSQIVNSDTRPRRYLE